MLFLETVRVELTDDFINKELERKKEIGIIIIYMDFVIIVIKKITNWKM